MIDDIIVGIFLTKVICMNKYERKILKQFNSTNITPKLVNVSIKYSQHASMSELLNMEDKRGFIVLMSTRYTTYVGVLPLKSIFAIGTDELYIRTVDRYFFQQLNDRLNVKKFLDDTLYLYCKDIIRKQHNRARLHRFIEEANHVFCRRTRKSITK